MKRNLIFVGQGPNRASWERELALGRRYFKDDEAKAEEFAEKVCERIALTGSCGRKLAGLLGTTVSEFFREARRENLNKRWNGKKGRGDSFDYAEGSHRAIDLMMNNPKASFVLLGAAVAHCFGFPASAPSSVVESICGRYLLMPHPSGLNKFWNSKTNRELARRELLAFIEKRKEN